MTITITEKTITVDNETVNIDNDEYNRVVNAIANVDVAIETIVNIARLRR